MHYKLCRFSRYSSFAVIAKLVYIIIHRGFQHYYIYIILVATVKR